MKASRTLTLVIIAVAAVAVAACASTTKRAKANVDRGMTNAQVREIAGAPDMRSFKDKAEAWQYQDVVGFGQCEYLTVWFLDGVVRGITTRRGGSVAGCGLGSTEVDWSQMPN